MAVDRHTTLGQQVEYRGALAAGAYPGEAVLYFYTDEDQFTDLAGSLEICYLHFAPAGSKEKKGPWQPQRPLENEKNLGQQPQTLANEKNPIDVHSIIINGRNNLYIR